MGLHGVFHRIRRGPSAQPDSRVAGGPMVRTDTGRGLRSCRSQFGSGVPVRGEPAVLPRTLDVRPVRRWPWGKGRHQEWRATPALYDNAEGPSIPICPELLTGEDLFPTAHA